MIFQGLDNDNPFMKYDFLWSLESSGCASDAFGWAPNHLIEKNEQGHITCFTPAYLKYNSFGEYIFDHAWVDFYNKVNIKSIFQNYLLLFHLPQSDHANFLLNQMSLMVKKINKGYKIVTEQV